MGDLRSSSSLFLAYSLGSLIILQGMPYHPDIIKLDFLTPSQLYFCFFLLLLRSKLHAHKVVKNERQFFFLNRGGRGGRGGGREEGRGGAPMAAAPLSTPAGKNLGATTRIGREIWCLPYVGFF